jgi:hypothetical protein
MKISFFGGSQMSNLAPFSNYFYHKAVKVDNKEQVNKMKKPINLNKITKSKPPVCNWLDSHKWATKVEIRRLLSGKPDLIIEKDIKKPAINLCVKSIDNIPQQ